MSEIKNGGPAFPCAEDHKIADAFPWTQGMSLRDWFAGQALAGFMSQPITQEDTKAIGNIPAYLATAAYRMADAMLAARNRAQ